jgi:hypothetical protein
MCYATICLLLFGRVSMRIKYNLIQDRIYCAGRKDLYLSPHTLCIITSRRMKSAVHVVFMGGKQHTFSVFVGKPEGRRQLEISGRRWDDIIKLKLYRIL